MMTHSPRLACKSSVLVVLMMAVPVSARASVREISVKELFARSDLVVVAKVVWVEPGPAELQPAGEEFPAVKVATAQVIETWKGAEVREVRYVATPTQICDISSAEEGERVVLFLEGSRKRPYWIAHVGRGRLPIHIAGDKTYATLNNQLTLPKGTPIVEKTAPYRTVLPSSEPGKPDQVIELKLTQKFIELSRLRQLVKGETRSDRPASPEGKRPNSVAAGS